MLRSRGLKQLCEDVRQVVCYTSMKLRIVVWAGDIHSVVLPVKRIFKTMGSAGVTWRGSMGDREETYVILLTMKIVS